VQHTLWLGIAPGEVGDLLGAVSGALALCHLGQRVEADGAKQMHMQFHLRQAAAEGRQIHHATPAG
jgi:hypothetical protein